MTDPNSFKIVRVQNVPPLLRSDKLFEIFKEYFGPDVLLAVNVAPDCCAHDGSQIAIAKFSPRLPDLLSELAIHLKGYTYSFDRHFFGLTQLYPTTEGYEILAE